MTVPATRLVEFGRALRDAGIPVPPTVARDFLDALEQVGASSGEDAYWAFRALTVTRRDQIPVFDAVFVDFFSGSPLPSTVIEEEYEPRLWAVEEGAEGDGEGDGEDATATTGASAVERLADKDFALLSPVEEAQVKAMVARMVWEPSTVPARRRRPARRGDLPDMRRTLRSAVGPEGEMLHLEMTSRTIRRRPMIVLADVSGSMERYAEMLLYFCHAARDRFGGLEAFVFSTSLTRITRELTRRRPSEAIAAVSERVHDWSGGTQIGAAIGTFNRDWSRRVSRGRPVALIISDGWDRGDPAILGREMERLHRTVFRVVWLNPLAGRPGFSPDTRGMQAALPHVDDFLAAGTLRDLRTLVRLLESVRIR